MSWFRWWSEDSDKFFDQIGLLLVLKNSLVVARGFFYFGTKIETNGH
jgi:hypothetical protein